MDLTHVFLLLAPLPYLDPGSGSLIIQLILGALFAAGLAVRLFWKRIKTFFRRTPLNEAETINEQKDGNE